MTEMHTWRITVLVAIAVAKVTACSKGASQTVAGSSAKPGTGAPQVPAGTACNRKLVTEAEASAILGAPILIVRDPNPGDAQTCDFEARGEPPLTVTLRPGQGDETVQAWLSGHAGPVSGTALPGVGERAAWVAKFRRLIATKNNLLCDISAQGIRGSVDAIQEKLVALCTKIFATAS
jgi:hypothetical protein